MTAKNFAACMKHVLIFEGGRVDDPHDPGGRTNQGVIQRVYDGWRERNGKPRQDVYRMTVPERDAIYREGYWNQIRGDELPPGIDIVVFDGAVNSGPQQSVKWLQRALGVARIDGVVGPATLAAIDAHPDHDALVAAMCERRLAFLRALRSWARFGKGWSSRVGQVRRIGQAWAAGANDDGRGVALTGAGAKAPIENASPLPARAPADAASGAGIASGGIAGTLQSTKDSLEPLAGSSRVIDYLIVGLALLCAALVIGGLGYRWYAARRASDMADALDLPAGVAA
ncbi:glycoside hydrolase family 108 protein [Bosea psychrotolerans]|uniref:Lysozyme family protein n=1 Tax=Bosea psychrotolerans TaxID=1871628 RepID=A0A2S4MCB3_9HYPH|nr:glycoside hydrolase family 108 protein [Bosea psychrotolerans]POR52383.1 lysozyme family protein [Bosea psychrotolerans]